jgi:cyclic dehypoxanthinyl futalosine synthase
LKLELKIPERVSREKGVRLFIEENLFSLGRFADSIRWTYHPEPVVTFIVDRNINYTNRCAVRCKFCAFSVDINDKSGYVLSIDEIFRKIEEAVQQGGTQILMQGGLNPELKIDFFENMFREIKKRFKVQIHSLSPPEIVFIAKISKLSIRDTIVRLHSAGLDSIPGGGAEILVDRVRKIISPKKISADEWLNVMREAHKLGMRTTATMMFGSVESPEEIIEHLLRIRDLQDETGGFTAFIPWSFQPGNTVLSGVPTTGTDYLRVVAISRIMLDNVPNIQASWVTQGLKVAQLALFFGANDMGNVMIEENVIASTGVKNSISQDELIKVIKDAGFIPAQRNTLYEIIKIFN